MDCIFCKIIRKEIPARVVYENDAVMAFHDANPKAPVHVLIVPKTHIPSVDHLTPKDAPLVGALFSAASSVARLSGAEDGYKLAINVGRKGGQIIDHLHLHLLAWPEGRSETKISSALEDKKQSDRRKPEGVGRRGRGKFEKEVFVI